MYCPSCGNPIGPTANFCSTCGSQVPAQPQQIPATPYAPPAHSGMERGRGTLILALGILSILMLGPILGIPAWIMGRRDLRKIAAGLIAQSEREMTKVGKVCGMIGTFISPFTMIVLGVAMAIGVSIFAAQSISENKDAMINDLTAISKLAYEYKCRPASLGGGGGSYMGFRIPRQYTKSENGLYEIVSVSASTITLSARSIFNTDNQIRVTVAVNGTPHDWQYFGQFE